MVDVPLPWPVMRTFRVLSVDNHRSGGEHMRRGR
jgi:hypothetical protein